MQDEEPDLWTPYTRSILYGDCYAEEDTLGDLELMELMEGRGLVLLSGFSRLHIYLPSGAHIIMIQGSEKVGEHPLSRDAASFPTQMLQHRLLWTTFYQQVGGAPIRT